VNEFQERVGVGRPLYAIGRTAPTRTRQVIAEEGPRKGRLAAIQTEHKSGRVDAQVFVDPIRRTISLSGRDTA
jgi:hypothetical protein